MKLLECCCEELDNQLSGIVYASHYADILFIYFNFFLRGEMSSFLWAKSLT